MSVRKTWHILSYQRRSGVDNVSFASRITAAGASSCELTVVLRVEPARVQGDPELRKVAHLMPWSALDAVVRASTTLHSVRLQFHNGHYGPTLWFSREMQEAIRSGVSRETMRTVEVIT